jgi:hypothetical protein
MIAQNWIWYPSKKVIAAGKHDSPKLDVAAMEEGYSSRET